MRWLILALIVVPLLLSSCGAHKVNYTVTLTVTSDYGNPIPAVGTHTYRYDSDHPPQVNASVESEIDAGNTIYTCSGWQGTGSVPASGTSNQVSFTLTEDSTLTWLWQIWHQVTVNTTGSGTVGITVVSGQENSTHTSFYLEGSVLQLTPNPGTGYVFSHWEDGSGNVLGNDSPLEITVNSPTSVTAVFVEQLTVATSQGDFDGSGYGMVGANYSFSLQATGGYGTYHWQVTGGAFPPGLALADDGTISGKPSAAGDYTFTVSVTDESPYPFTAQATFTITVYERLQITTTSLPGAVNNQNYSTNIDVSGGSGGYTFAISGEPSGVSINPSSGLISGTPNDTAGTYTITVTVTDNYNAAWTDSKNLTLNLADALTLTAQTYTWTERIAVSGSVPYSGGWAPVEFRVVSGALPPGTYLNIDGTYGGTPVAAGQYTAVIEARDSLEPQQFAYQTYTYNVKPAVPSDFTVDVRAGSGVVLKWTDNSSSETNYVIQRSDDGGTTWSEIAVLPADATEFTDQSAPFGNSSVLYRVVARGWGDIDSDYVEDGPFTIPESVVAGFPATDRAYKVARDGDMLYIAWRSSLANNTLIAAYDLSVRKWVWAYRWAGVSGCDDLVAGTSGGSKYVVARAASNYLCCIKDGQPIWNKSVTPSGGSLFSIKILSDALFVVGSTTTDDENIFLAKLNLADGSLVNSWGIELDDDGNFDEDERAMTITFPDTDTAYLAGRIRIDGAGARHMLFVRLTGMSAVPTFSSACYVAQNLGGLPVQADWVAAVRADTSGNCCAITDESIWGVGSFVGGVGVTYDSGTGNWNFGWARLWGDGTPSRLLGADECGWLATFNSSPGRCIFAQFDPLNGNFTRQQSIGEKAPAYHGSLCYYAPDNRYYKLVSTSYFLDDNIATTSITEQTPNASVSSLKGNIYGASVTIDTAPPLVAVDPSQINPTGSPYGDDDAAVFWHNP